MVAAVINFPGAAPIEREPPGLHLSEAEVIDAACGYRRPADQLRELHARGFTRAIFSKVGRKRVLLERGHYEAVIRGQFGAPPAPSTPEAAGPRPNAGALNRLFESKRRR